MKFCVKKEYQLQNKMLKVLTVRFTFERFSMYSNF